MTQQTALIHVECEIKKSKFLKALKAGKEEGVVSYQSSAVP